MANESNTQEIIKNSKKFFAIPYEGKIKKFYFIYLALFGILALLIYISNLFIIINLINNNKYSITSNISDINITITPILNLLLITISLILLSLAPQRIHHSPKQSSVMFYFSFWMLVISTLLNSQLQLNYIDVYLTSTFYNWLNGDLVKIIIIISVISLFFIEVFFWIMRRKFTFMPTDYEIYMTRIEKKLANKAVKAEKKLSKKHDKLNEKIAKSHLKEANKMSYKIKKEAENAK